MALLLYNTDRRGFRSEGAGAGTMTCKRDGRRQVAQVQASPSAAVRGLQVVYFAIGAVVFRAPSGQSAASEHMSAGYSNKCQSTAACRTFEPSPLAHFRPTKRIRAFSEWTARAVALGRAGWVFADTSPCWQHKHCSGFQHAYDLYAQLLRCMWLLQHPACPGQTACCHRPSDGLRLTPFSRTTKLRARNWRTT